MTLSGDELDYSLEVVKMLLSKGVSGRHHKQSQTIAGWFPTHERGDVKQTIDAMVADTDVPLRRKGRGTVQLTSVPAGKRYLENHGRDPPSTW